MPQFDRLRNKMLNWENLSLGAFLFSIGLAKKVIVADTFAIWANNGFASAGALNCVEAWVASIAYTLQLYFDFSGYTDMALGLARMFNIRLPRNFNSPYKALNIQDFWKRWHMTLSRFLRDYVYIPLGGNRKGKFRTYLNVLVTFVIGGLWHGAGWTFVVWGFLHGVANVLHRLWRVANAKLTRPLAWLATFCFVVVCWVFFRAKTLADAAGILKGMIGLNGVMLPKSFEGPLSRLKSHGIQFSSGYMDKVLGTQTGITGVPPFVVVMTIVFLLICSLMRNSDELTERLVPNTWTLILAAVLFVVSVLSMNKVTAFLYFNF
jgi:alginate O-acetyltransferase complex protein AlgI